MKVVKDKNNLPKVARLLTELGRKVIKVGIQSDEDADLVTYARANEFGAMITHRKGKRLKNPIIIPERSFVRSTADDPRQVKKAARAGGRTMLRGGTATQIASAMALSMEGSIKRTITSDVPPPNAPSTLERKPSRGTLRWSGRMKDAVRGVVA